MKIIKGLGILLFFSVVFGACFDPPQFPITPKIAYDDIYFRQTPEVVKADTLVVTIKFKDGDGDLGIDSKNDEYISDPYHVANFYLETNGDLAPISTEISYSDLPSIIKVPDGLTGKLATVRTRKKPGYENLPPYLDPYTCISYQYDSVFISEEDAGIFDGSYNLVKTYQGSPKIYVLLDTFYFAPNPNHYNITVKYLIFDQNNPLADSEGFVEFDWRKELCTTFDGRFPVLSDKTSPLEGTIRYSMISTGFLNLFSIKKMKLRIWIKDRALNLSDSVDTKVFTLEQIRR